MLSTRITVNLYANREREHHIDATTTRDELEELLGTATTAELLHILNNIRLHSWQMRMINTELKLREI